MYEDITIQRFWQSVDGNGENGCWTWMRAPSSEGYGRLYEGRREIKATHISLYLDGRPRPEGMNALHSCDNRICVNPSHLRWGTQAENARDMVSRGRHGSITKPDSYQNRTYTQRNGKIARGPGRAFPLKRTDAMIEDALQGPGSIREIAARNGVSKRLINNIRKEHGAAPRPFVNRYVNPQIAA